MNSVVSCLFFSKLTVSKNYFRYTIRVSNSLDPDQARHFVWPGLGPNCFQRVKEQLVTQNLHCKEYKNPS